MEVADQQAPASSTGRLVLAAIVLSLAGLTPFFAVPLAVLVLASGPRTRPELFIGALAGGLGLAWLMDSGTPPDQLVRAAVLVGSAAFVLASRFTRWSVTHRALLAIGVAGTVILSLFVLFGWTWEEVAWWVRYRTGYETTLRFGPLRGAGGEHPAFSEQLDNWIALSAEFAMQCFPALLAIQMLVGFGLATAIYHRVSSHPVGRAPGRFRHFRFSEHLGWAAAIPLLVVLLPKLAAGKVAAANMLLVIGSLYALRGVAVAAFGATLAGNTPLTTLLLVGAAVFMLPVMLGAAVLLGVLDAGLDLRRRWSKPPVSK